jgi:hypothetical protein
MGLEFFVPAQTTIVVTLLKVHAEKSAFSALEIEYLGYILTRDGIKPQSNKVQAILTIESPKGVKQLRHFVGTVQYYCDLWARGSDMLTPLTSLVGEYGQTKLSKAKGTKNAPWHWDEVHQRAFNHVKATIAKEVVLAYPDFSKVFEIYTDASRKQLGAIDPATRWFEIVELPSVDKATFPTMGKGKKVTCDNNYTKDAVMTLTSHLLKSVT